MIGYYGSKSGCYSEALWDHYWSERGMAAQVDSLDGRNPTFRGAEFTATSCHVGPWNVGVCCHLENHFSQIMMMMIIIITIIIIIFYAQSMLLLMCCKLRIVQELVQLPALRACLLEALRHGIRQTLWTSWRT